MDDRLRAILTQHPGSPDTLIPLLQHVQEEFGYLSAEAMLAVARWTGVPESRVYGVATFYRQFHLAPIGRTHIQVCRGTPCHGRGAPRILAEIEKHLGIREGETTPDGKYSLETVACTGACGASPCVMTNQKVEAPVTPASVPAWLQEAGEHGQ